MFSSTSNGSNNSNTKNRDLSKSISKATMLLTGSGPPIHKQLKMAIMEGNEDKAISIYKSKEGSKVHPSKPFPTKKVDSVQDTPLHVTAKYALTKLFAFFLECGGNPSVVNIRKENCAHATCLMTSFPMKRGELIDLIFSWQGVRPDNNIDIVPIDQTDIDGNTALHLAAFNGLLPCIERLMKYDATLSIFNRQNLSICEIADVGGHLHIGLMLELAWVYSASNVLQEAAHMYQKFSTEVTMGGKIIVDGKSIPITGLIEFINNAIKNTSDSLDETAARSEVLLNLYGWDVKKLKKEYAINPERVLNSARLKPRQAIANKTEGHSEAKKDGFNVGLNIEDVYLDPPYRPNQTFTVLQDGKKKNYSIQNYDGKYYVYPVDYDHTLRYVDKNQISETSHIKPKKTEACPMCGEVMLEPANIQHFISGSIVEPTRREIKCTSGHKYCFSCWADHALVQLKTDHSPGCLPCPADNCGEILDLQWASVILKKSDLMNRLLTQRQHHVISTLGLRWCPFPNCGLLVKIDPQAHSSSPTAASVSSNYRTSTLGSNSDSFRSLNSSLPPKVAVCDNGHSFCLSCAHEAHSPCLCADLTNWQELLREETKLADPNDAKNITNILLHTPSTKKCSDCSGLIHKEDGCNNVTCSNCYNQYCWTCMQDWSSHTTKTNNMFYCNHFKERKPAGAISSAPQTPNANESDESKQSDSAPKISKYDRIVRIIHYYTRYNVHTESHKLEQNAKRLAYDRLLLGLRASRDGQLLWLQGIHSQNPLLLSPDGADDSIVSQEEKTSTFLKDYFISVDDAISFLCEAFDELAKCRMFLKWTYPFAMYELDDGFQRFKDKGSPLRLRMNKEKIEEIRAEFDLLQASLEYNTEVLSDLIARKRLRATRQQIGVATLAARTKRLEFELLIIHYYSLSGPEVLSPTAHEASLQRIRTTESYGEIQERNANEVLMGIAENAKKPSPLIPHRTASLEYVDSDEEEVGPYVMSPNASQKNLTGLPPKRSLYRFENGGGSGSGIGYSSGEDSSGNRKNKSGNKSMFRAGSILTASMLPEDDPTLSKTPEGYVLVKSIHQPKVPEPPKPEPPPPPPAPEPQNIVEQRLIGMKKDPDEEALEHAILISKQEEEFGINMYDAVNEEDEPTIREYMDDGFTREEAILIIFEEKVGKVSIQSNEITPAMPTLHKISSTVGLGRSLTTAPSFMMSYGSLLDDGDEPEIESLMVKGYTREQALEVIGKRKQRELEQANNRNDNSSAFNMNAMLNTSPTTRPNDMRVGAIAPPTSNPSVYHPTRTSSEDSAPSLDNLLSLGYTRDQALSILGASPTNHAQPNQPIQPSRPSTTLVPSQASRPAAFSNDSYENTEDNQIMSYMDMGYTREQAIHLIRGNRPSPNEVSPPNPYDPIYSNEPDPYYLPPGYTSNRASMDGSMYPPPNNGYDGGMYPPNYDAGMNQNRSIFRAPTMAGSDPMYGGGYPPYEEGYDNPYYNGYYPNGQIPRTATTGSSMYSMEDPYGTGQGSFYDPNNPDYYGYNRSPIPPPQQQPMIDDDESEIRRLLSQGYQYEDAVALVYDHRRTSFQAPAPAPAPAPYSPYSDYDGHEDLIYNNSANNSSNKPKKMFIGQALLRGRQSRPSNDSEMLERTIRNSQEEALRTSQIQQSSPANNSNQGPRYDESQCRYADILQLESLGFNRANVIHALIDHNHNVEAAANYLLTN